jgi:hypothetical protein
MLLRVVVAGVIPKQPNDPALSRAGPPAHALSCDGLPGVGSNALLGGVRRARKPRHGNRTFGGDGLTMNPQAMKLA